MKILVIGSMNMDLVVETNHLPQKGETTQGKSFSQIPGGKGANQSLAAAKLGGDVSLVAACGKDYYGDILIKKLSDGGVKTENVFRVNKNTGIASITIEKDGDNRIIIVPGANGELIPEMIDMVEDQIKEAGYILLQMEIPLKTLIYIIELASEYNVKVILDPAPPQTLPDYIYQKIDYMLPNELELDALVKGNKYNSLEEKANHLLQKGVKRILVTCGEKGVYYFSRDKIKKYDAYKVEVVDTTAAGDAFAGALGYGLARGWDENKTIEFANKVAAYAVSKFGAQTSLPALEEVFAYHKM